MSNLPTLDFSKFYFGSEDEKGRLGENIVKSFVKHGFVKLINHGIRDDTVAKSFQWSKNFFELPQDVKDEIVCVRGPNLQRGWSRVGLEQTARLREDNTINLNAGELTDEREHFDAGPMNDPVYINKWPREDAAPGFREFMEETYGAFQGVSLAIMACVEMGLGLQPGTLVRRCRKAASEIRLNRYPPVSLERLSDGRIKRTWPHTDFGIITLLFQDLVGGLELEDRTRPGTFVPVVPSLPGQPVEMIVNASNTIQRWTNDAIPAGLHQVTSPPSHRANPAGILPERHSVVFFFKASRGISAGPLPEFVTVENPAHYNEITALQYQQEMTQKLYSMEPF
ncbi:putative Oxoglutarate/iron-dependent oxygenase [Seiridium unicorne]|uniref:Oxoglutarate/iron-dependent oxygenase n=1 Tax=Seiridium unicorne TaxID=138068 RepID=A0ABR2UKT9_9PEZI